MSYYLSVKLKQIKYSGDNIGRELKFKLAIGNQDAQINIRLSQGEQRYFDKVVFHKIVKEKSVTIPIATEIRETSERYIDFGSGRSKLKKPLKEGTTRHILSVEVEGNGRDRGKTAIFTLVVEVLVESAICYISDVWPNGWLKVKFDNGDIYPLPQWLKVEIIKIEKGREYFKVLEGKFKGRNASVRLGEDGKSYLLRRGKHQKQAELIFDHDANKLIVVGLGTYHAKVELSLIPKGKYDLEIPDEPHPLGEYYLKYSKYAKTWFRIGHEGERYLHVGRRSAGCLTVTDKEKWTEIYNFLIRSRKDFVSIGEVIVK